MKMPKLKRPFFFRRKKKLQANARSTAARQTWDELEENEPRTRLSSAFFIVFIVHVVAVGGVCAYSSIKKHRAPYEPAVVEKPAATKVAAPAAKPTATAPKVVTTAAPAATAAQKPPQHAPVQLAALPQKAEPEVAPVSGNRIHRVVEGDTLWDLAKKYDVTVAEIEEANGLKNGSALSLGRVLNVPAAKPGSRPVATDPRKPEPPKETPRATAAARPARSYVVAKGDTLIGIAKKFSVNSEDIIELNRIKNPKTLSIGTSLKIPAKK